jgi:integrase
MSRDLRPDEAAMTDIAAPSRLPAPGSGALDRLVEDARAYARGAASPNTLRAYARDWAHYARWARRHGGDPLPPSPEMVGLYLAWCAAPRPRGAGLSVATIERRLSGLCWGFAQRGAPLDRADRHVAAVLAGVRRAHARPPAQKEALSADELRAMLATLGHDLRGLRDRAMLLAGFAGGLRRSEIVALDRARDDTVEGAGWVAIEEGGMVIALRGKTGWREVEIGRGSTPATCPVAALETWLAFARIENGPLFRRVSRDGRRVLAARLSDQHVALLVKRTVAQAGVRGDLPEAERVALFSGHSLRAGLATWAEVEERHVQKQLGHASAEMTRRYQRRRDRFRVNLTRAAGL